VSLDSHLMRQARGPRIRTWRTAAWWGVAVALLCAYAALAGLLAALWAEAST
jgi:hypothetical protein